MNQTQMMDEQKNVTPRLRKIMAMASKVAKERGVDYIGPDEFLVAAMQHATEDSGAKYGAKLSAAFGKSLAEILAEFKKPAGDKDAPHTEAPALEKNLICRKQSIEAIWEALAGGVMTALLEWICKTDGKDGAVATMTLTLTMEKDKDNMYADFVKWNLVEDKQWKWVHR